MTGCASEPIDDVPSDVLTKDELLVPIPRELDEAVAARRAEIIARTTRRDGEGRTFYLAVRRSALSERWFWSVYLKELQPFGPSPGTLGTKVVRFREQNGKLYVFDADDRRRTSDVFNPDLIIDAFPIVDSHQFHSLPGSGGYILIDPAAGLNRFSALADLFATSPAVRLETELSFVQDFHAASDGGRFEQIITAYADQEIGLPGDVEDNELRMAATLGVNLRRYTESPGYVEVPAPPREHYFLSQPKIIPNTGVLAQTAAHWAFRPGRAPIVWKISPEILELQQHPELGGADLFRAIKDGIESWNATLGYQAIRAELAGPNDSFADDHTNYFIVDPDTSLGFAYADWRTNPNTGEVRGASVYFSSAFFAPFPDDAAAAPGAVGHSSLATNAKAKTRRVGLSWKGEPSEPLCVLWARDWQARQPDTAANLTGAEKLERYIQHVAAHEVGHTLGLRHNFKGSLVPPTSSVMEYNVSDATFEQPTPAAYDHQAIGYLYGRTPSLPTLPFCTDEDTVVDPNCVRFDIPTPQPLYDYQIPDCVFFTGLVTEGVFPPRLADLVARLVCSETYAYARTGTPTEAADAWAAALEGVRPASRSPLATPEGLDAATAAIFRELLIRPRGQNREPISDETIRSALAADAKTLLVNADGVLSYATRRLLVDALKNAQTTQAYVALLDARDAITAALPGLPALDQALTLDLLARLNAAISPYYEQ